jgi:hypothetical protein
MTEVQQDAAPEGTIPASEAQPEGKEAGVLLSCHQEHYKPSMDRQWKSETDRRWSEPTRWTQSPRRYSQRLGAPIIHKECGGKLTRRE